jgi:oligoribonuclease (3'-5' exoribonuclease)
MLSFASATFKADKTMVSTFTANLVVLPGACPAPETASWWTQNPVANEATRTNQEKPETAMVRYVEWLEQLPGKPVFVGYPAGYDFLFVYWYLIRFAKKSPFSFSALDVKTFAMAVLKLPYREVSKRTMPNRWFDPTKKHTHIALDDAIEQGILFCNMLAEHTRRAPSSNG